MDPLLNGLQTPQKNARPEPAMASNASIDSLSDVSSVSMDAGLETGPEAGGEALYDDGTSTLNVICN